VIFKNHLCGLAQYWDLFRYFRLLSWFNSGIKTYSWLKEINSLYIKNSSSNNVMIKQCVSLMYIWVNCSVSICRIWKSFHLKIKILDERMDSRVSRWSVKYNIIQFLYSYYYYTIFTTLYILSVTFGILLVLYYSSF